MGAAQRLHAHSACEDPLTRSGVCFNIVGPSESLDFLAQAPRAPRPAPGLALDSRDQPIPGSVA